MSDETKIPNLRAVRMEADAAAVKAAAVVANEAALSGQVAGQYEIQETGELVSWNGTTITARGPALAPLTRVLQLEDEIIANLVPDYVWGAPSQPVTQNPEILNAALELGMTTGKPVRVKAGTYWMPRTVKPTADTWRRCELYGAGAAHPQSIGRSVVTKAGTVFIGNNNTILEIDFLDIANETVQITGIGFLNDVDTPAFGLPPIILRKKNPRYISGHKIDISLYNWSAGLTWVGANSTVSANYVGPMELTVNSYLVRRPIQFLGVTANRCIIYNSLWHEVDGICLYVGVGNALGGGNTKAAFMGVMDTCHSESSLGIFEFPYTEIKDDGGYTLRNSIELRSFTHEYTGATKNADGSTSGTQWQAGMNTDIYVSGRWDNPRGFGESGTPSLPATCTLSSTSPITILEEGGLIFTPDTVNDGGYKQETVASGASITLKRTARYQATFDVDLNIKINGGIDGHLSYVAFGKAENGKKQTNLIQNAQVLASNITITPSEYPAHTDMYNLIITNNTASPITVESTSRLKMSQTHPTTGF